MTEFLKSLAKGDLVLASNWGSDKIHLVRLNVTANEREGCSPDSERYSRLEGSWDARPLCPARPRYYWRPQTDPRHEEDRCRICFQRWRADGKATGQRELIKGWTKQVVNAKDWTTWPLPFAWKQLPVSGHPYDVPPGGDVNTVIDKEGNVVGQLRTEVYRWQRGHRVVRIAEQHGESARGYVTLYHNDTQPLKERTAGYGSLNDCLEYAWKTMAKGGRT